MSEPDLVRKIEALLFVAEAPVSLAVMADLLQVPEGVAEEGIALLARRLDDTSAVQVVRISGGYQLCTRPEMADLIEQFLKPQHRRLSRSLLEVLAIVAYRQPVTQSEIEQVRGVQSDYGLRTLVDRGYVREVGRRDTPGRPILYGTTQLFLHQFNLNSLNELPNVEGRNFTELTQLELPLD